jgi:branched-chain amino acid transport system permease protein
MPLIIQVIITGLTLGAGYALFGLCISVLYRATGIVHLAIGELAGLATFTVILIAFGSEPIAGAEPRMSLGLAVALALAITGACGVLVFRVAVLPFLRRGFSVAWVGGILATAVILRGAVRIVFPDAAYRMPELLPVQRFGTDGVVSLGEGATIRVQALIAGAVALGLVLAAIWLLERSPWGMRLRAASEDRLAAELCGVPVERVQLWAFGAAAALAGIVGLVTMSGQIVTTSSGSLLGLKGLVAAIAARFARPRLVVAAALGLGLLETTLSSANLGGLELGPAYADVVPIAIAIALLAYWGDRARLRELA